MRYFILLLLLALHLPLTVLADNPMRFLNDGIINYAEGNTTPVQISLLPFPFFMRLYGSNVNVCGLNIGLWAVQESHVTGVSLTAIGHVDTFKGFALGGYLDHNNSHGFDLSLLSTKTYNYGLSVGLVEYAHDNLGMQVALVNLTIGRPNYFTWKVRGNLGTQFGLINLADGVDCVRDEKAEYKEFKIIKVERKNFLQIGLINTANHGWQFGLFNYNKNSICPYSVFFNYSPPPDASPMT